MGEHTAISVPVFVKQLGAVPVSVTDRISISVSRPHTLPPPPHSPGTVLITDRKGGDMAEWPADLRIREFPAVGGAL